MRIGIDARELTKNSLTGIGRYLLNFLKYVSAGEAKHEFILFCNQRSFIPINASNIKKKIIHEYFTLWWDQVSLPLALNRENVDVFFSPYFKAPFFTKKKTIITIHDLHFLTPYFMKGFNKFRFFKILGKLSAKKANKIISVSNYSKVEIMRLFGIPKNKIKVIYNGVDEQFRPEGNKQVLETVKQKYTNGEDYLLFVGNFFPTKNTEVLIKAYQKLQAELKNRFRLLMVAKKSPYYNKAAFLIKRLSIADRVNIIESVDDSELSALYSGADLLVLPSFYEGFGFPAVEAMACGTPVVASNAASIPEVVDDAALLIDPHSVEGLKNGIERLLCNQGLRIKLIDKGLERVKKFSVEAFVEQVIKLIEEVAREKEDRFYWSEFSSDDRKNLVNISKEKGWRFVLENIVKPRSLNTYNMFFDDSRADWEFLLPLNKDSIVLDAGAGWGALSFSLGKTCGKVYALDGVLEKVEFMKIRAAQEEIKNVIPMDGDILKLPFPDGSFDLVVLNGVLEWAGMVDKARCVVDVQKDMLQEVFRVLKKDGYLYLAIENRFAAIYLLGWKDPHVNLRFISLLPRRLADIYCKITKGTAYRTYTHSSFSYKRLLNKAGFSEVKFYSPFPSYRRFTHIIPLDNYHILSYYIKNLVRPKTLSQSFFINIIKMFRLYRFIRFFVPDYSILAKK